MSDLDTDRILALSYVPARHRSAVEALWRLDAAFGAVLAGGREPMLSRIKLVWWRDALEALDSSPAPGEPVLQALAAHVLPRGVRGAELAAMEQGWSALLSPDPLTDEEIRSYAAARGALLFELSARLLGQPVSKAGAAGQAWALADLARHSNETDAEVALRALRNLEPPGKVPPPLRPLGMLAALAFRDAQPGRPRWEPQGAPRRMLRMLRHRLTGH